MLYKPSNPFPYNSVIDADTSGLLFTASCVDISDIKGIRLSIKDNTCEYYLPVKNGKMGDCINTSSIEIPFSTDILNDKTGYCIKSNNFSRTTGVNISNIIKPLKQYRWQLRLYQEKERSTINIAYGFVQDVITAYDGSGNKQLRRILKVRPHTNMFFKHLNEDGSHNTIYDSGISKQLTEYYDDNVDYYIVFDGQKYKVADYYYKKTSAYYDSAKKQQSLNVEMQYNEVPLFAYIEIDLDANNKDDDGNIVETINAGDQYTILTNYIDSNEYYFECRQAGDVTFTDRQNATVNFTNGLTPSDKDTDVFKLGYSNFKLTGTYNPNGNGATVNYYRFMLYEVADNGNKTLLNDTGNIYRSDIVYEYDDFFAGKTYKLVTNITDTNRKTIVKSVLIKPTYQTVVAPLDLDVRYYNENKSVLIDVGNVISISGTEAVEGAHDGGNDDATDYCHVHKGNSITYSKTDLGKDLVCHNPTFSIVFKVTDSDDNTIFELEDDDGYTHTLAWHNYYFKYERTKGTSGKHAWFSPYKGFSAGLFSGYNSSWDGKVDEALRNKNLNYAVPYLALENLHTGLADEKEDDAGSGVFLHTESIVADYWWQFILANDEVYIHCLSTPTGFNTAPSYPSEV